MTRLARSFCAASIVKTGEVVGDGTTTATVLARTIVKDGSKAVAARMSPI
jgi:chaperonin GroEL